MDSSGYRINPPQIAYFHMWCLTVGTMSESMETKLPSVRLGF